MAWLFGDSFDHYADARKLEKWTIYTPSTDGTITIVAGQGTLGSQALQLLAPTGIGGRTTGVLSNVPNGPTPSGATMIFGFRINVAEGMVFMGTGTDPDDGFAGCLCVGRGSSVNLFWLRIETNGKISVYRGTTLLGTSSVGLSQGTLHFLECHVVLDNSAGTVRLWLDNAPVLSLSGIDSTNGGTAWDEFRWGNLGTAIGGAIRVYIDDFYLMDGTGAVTALKNRWGPTTAYATYPNAAGFASDWSRSTGSDQWATIDEALMNGDVDYNFTDTLDAEDLLNFPDIDISNAPIRGIQGNVEVRTEDGGAAEVTLLTRQSSTTYDGTARTVPATYLVRREPWGVNPATGSPWTEAEYNAAQFGYKKTA